MDAYATRRQPRGQRARLNGSVPSPHAATNRHQTLKLIQQGKSYLGREASGTTNRFLILKTKPKGRWNF